LNSVNLAPHRFISSLEQALELSLAKGPDAGNLLDAARRLALGHGAKRVRPRLVLAAASSRGLSLETLVDVAVTGELVHTASLLHDDVVDEGTLRRGQPTANATWGNAVAVLSGDLVLSLALERLRRLPVALLAAAIDVVLCMSRASILEISNRGTLELGTLGWQRVALGKTAELFGWCCAAPAVLAGNDAEAERYRNGGKHLGLAYQLADDLSDLLPQPTGKDRFADLVERTPSYPLLIGAAASRVVRDGIGALWAGPRVDPLAAATLGEQLLSMGVADLTRVAIDQELAAARVAFGAVEGPLLVDEVISLWGGAACLRGEEANRCAVI
jgi:geranylgeranyl pyrophosphate synthase